MSRDRTDSADNKKRGRMERLQQMLAELATLPDFARGPARRKIERKARKWGITLTEFAAASPDLDSTGAFALADDGDGKKPYGDVVYADPGYQADKKKRYPIDTEAHIRAAWNYINKSKNAKQYNAERLSRIKSRIISAWKAKIDKEGPPSAAEHASEFDFATELIELAERTVDRFGREAYRIPVALTGRWVKGDEFSVTEDDIDRMIENFEKRANGEIVVDYEHASENPDVAKGEPIPAAGWMSSLAKEPVADNYMLTGLFAPNERARALIDKKEYRYLSPAIDFGGKDKLNGQSQGATLTSVALTNKPFLDMLPAVELTACYRSTSAVLLTDLKGGTVMNATEQIRELREKADALKAAGDEKAAEYAKALAEIKKLEEQMLSVDEKSPRLKLRKMTGGARKGQFGAFTMDGNAPVGYVMADDMEPDEDEGDKAKDKEMREYMAAQKLQLSDVRSLVEKGREAVASEAGKDGKKILMTECVSKGVFDRSKAAVCAAEHQGKISVKDYAAVELADSILDKAGRDGRILPIHREALFEDVLVNPEKWKKLLTSAAPLFNTEGAGAPGSTEGADAPVEERVSIETQKVMKDRQIKNFAEAMRVVLSENAALAAEYQRARSKKTA